MLINLCFVFSAQLATTSAVKQVCLNPYRHFSCKLKVKLRLILKI